MDVENLENYISAYLHKRGIPINQSAINVLVSPEFLNTAELKRMESEDILRNVNILLNAIVSDHLRRVEKQFRNKNRWWKPAYSLKRKLFQRSITDMDVLPVLNELTGRLTPYVRSG